MRQNIRRLIVMVLAVLIAFGATTAFAEGPVSYDDPQTFTLWCPIGKAAGVIPDMSEDLVFKTMKDLTNVTIEFQHPAAGGETDAFNLMCASGDLPDAIAHGWLSVAGGPAKYISEGIIIPLNDLIDQHAPNLKAYLEAHPDIKRSVMLDDGTYYMLPSIYEDRDLAVSVGPIVRGDLLDEIGMTAEDIPTTIAGWEEMLTKVRDCEALEGYIPLTFQTLTKIAEGPFVLGAYGIAMEFYNDNGTVKYGALQPEYKEFLATMRRWYEAGLIDSEFAATDLKMLDEKVTANRAFSFVGSMGNSITRYTAMCRGENPDFQLLPTKYPTINEGEICPLGNEAFLATSGVAITSLCENPELIVKYFDYFFTEEGHMLSNWGIQGETYDLDENGEPYFLPIIIENPEGFSREQAMAKYTIWQSNFAIYKRRDVLEERDRLPEQIEGRKNWMACTNDILMPPVTPTEEEANEYATIMNDCSTFMRQQSTKIIMGEVDLDEGFEVLGNTLKGMGIDRAAELRQVALDRYLARP